jgi:uncharacterized membrane protein
MRATRWIKGGSIVLMLAIGLHLLVVWLIPRAITAVFLRRIAAQAGYNQIVLSPLPTDKSRDVVKPSSDLLYALCIYDISAGPVRISARPSPGYWSIALYARNSDNFFHLNDLQVKDGRVDLILSDAGRSAELRARYPDAILVQPASTVGLMLTRSLVLDPDDIKPAIDARSSTRCAPLKD